MPISIKDLRQVKATQPPRCIIYGPPGIGKTTLASEWPNPIFLQIEDGTPSDLELLSFGRMETYEDVYQSIVELYNEDHSGKTVVLDSLDKLEPLVWAKTCAENGNWASIEAPGYGKGYVAADYYWRELLDGMNGLRRDKHMGVVYIAHSSIETVNDPMTASYSRYDIRLHKRAIGIFQDECDAILFINQDVTLLANDAKAKSGPGSRVRATGGGNRYIHATPRPAYVAKNRYGLPDRIEYKKDHGYEVLAPYFPQPEKKTEPAKKTSTAKQKAQGNANAAATA